MEVSWSSIYGFSKNCFLSGINLGKVARARSFLSICSLSPRDRESITSRFIGSGDWMNRGETVIGDLYYTIEAAREGLSAEYALQGASWIPIDGGTVHPK